MTKRRPTDPMERVIADALDAIGVEYVCDDNGSGLDFMVQPDIYIEVKRYHSDRIAEQMSRVQNVIAIQGMDAARWFARMIGATRAT